MPHDAQSEHTSTSNDDLTEGSRRDPQTVGSSEEIDLDGTAQEAITLEPAGPGRSPENDPDDAEQDDRLVESANTEGAAGSSITGGTTPELLTAPTNASASQATATPQSITGFHGEVRTTPHSAAGKAERIEQLIVEGKKKQAMTLIHSIIRDQARKAVRREDGERIRQTRDPAYFLKPEWRAQWSGQDIVAIAQTISKGVYKGDMSCTNVLQAWHDRVEAVLRRQPDADMAAIEISQMIVIKDDERNAAYRRSLANGLTEIQVQVAELTGRNPHEYVRPIRVSDLDDADGASAPMVEETDGEACVSAGEEAAT